MMRRMLWCVMHGRCIFVLVVNLVYLVATCAYDGMESMSLNPMIGPCAAPAAAAKHERQPDDRPVCRRMPAAKLKPQKDVCGRADDERPQSCVHAHTRLSPPACCVGSRRTAKGLLKMGAKNSDLIFDCKDFWRIITCNWMHVGWVYTHHCTRGMCPSGIGPLIHAQRRNATLLCSLWQIHFTLNMAGIFYSGMPLEKRFGAVLCAASHASCGSCGAHRSLASCGYCGAHRSLA